MKILVKIVNGLVVPTQANPDDAGYDVTATSEPNIVGVKIDRPVDGIKAWSKIDYIEYKTNLFLAPQDCRDTILGDCQGDLKKFHINGVPRSSICKKNLVLANSIATLDNGYRGEILFRFKYIVQPEDLIMLPEYGANRFYALLNPDNIYKLGDKIAQLKAEANVPIEFEKVIELNNTMRGTGGFGSSS